MISYAARTDVGCRRQHNEDSMLALPDHGVFIVADGVGGRAAGEVASRITVETFDSSANELYQVLADYADKPEWTTRNRVLQVLDEVCQRASRTVYDQAEELSKKGMTTTLVAALVGGGSAFLAHVGDSRAYLLRDGTLRQLTEDHSMVNEMVSSGKMTYEEAIHSPYRNVITRAIGMYPTVQVDMMSLEVLPGDRLLLCSDGLSDPVPGEKVERLAALAEVPAAAEQLIQAALQHGAPDNVTAILVEPEASAQYEAARARAKVMEELFLFRDLPFHARMRVSRICEEAFFAPGELLVKAGTQGDSMFVIVEGEVGVTLGDVELARLGHGEHFGELALLEDQPRSANVSGTTFGSAIVIRRRALQEFCLREPSLATPILWKLAVTLGQRLREANSRVTASKT